MEPNIVYMNNFPKKHMTFFNNDRRKAMDKYSLQKYRQSPIFLSLTKNFLLVTSCKHGNFSSFLLGWVQVEDALSSKYEVKPFN